MISRIDMSKLCPSDYYMEQFDFMGFQCDPCLAYLHLFSFDNEFFIKSSLIGCPKNPKYFLLAYHIETVITYDFTMNFL